MKVILKNLIENFLDSIYKTEIFLFNNSKDNLSYVLCKNKVSEEDFDAVNLYIYIHYGLIFTFKIANEVDNNFLIISEKSKILNFRQTYSIDTKIFKLGDLVFKLGSIYRDILNRNIFIEIHNPYNNKYEEIKEFSYEIIQSLLFPQFKLGTLINNQNLTNYTANNNQNFNASNSLQISEFCLFDSVLEKLYRDERLKINNHWEIIQYVQLVFKK